MKISTNQNPEKCLDKRVALQVLDDNTRAAGTYNVTWDGRDERGFCVENGVYFYRLKVNEFIKTNKVIHIR